MSRVQAALAAAVVAGFFTVLILLFVQSDPEGKNGLREARLIMLGSLTAGFGAVLAYYYGSTSGSDKKTELLAHSTPTPPEPTTVTTTSDNSNTTTVQSNEGKQP
jgi:hypothetical protein